MKRKLYISIIILLLLFGALGTVSSESRRFEVSSSQREEQSDDFKGEIDIVNNSALHDFAERHGLEGNGTEKEPYLLVNHTINGAGDGYGLYLSDIDLYFIVKNTVIYNTSQAGVGIFQVSNFTLERSSLRSTGTGIWLEDSSRNSILNNLFEQSQAEGIKIKGSSLDNSFLNNHFEDCGILIEEDKQTMSGQRISGNTINGYPLYYFKDGYMKEVTGDVGQVIIVNSSGSGNKDIGPARIDKGSVGITIAYSQNISLENVIVKDQSDHGIQVIGSENIRVKNSTVRENDGNGIFLSHSTQIEIEDNEIYLNEKDGIYASSVDNSLFKTNNIRSNGRRGIDINTLRSELDSDSRPVPSEQNTISRNLIEWSRGYGIHISGNSFHNEIFLNAVISNKREWESHISAGEEQAFEDIYDTTLCNNWNSEEGLGNHWGEWNAADENQNGIIDTSYEISGSDSKDHFPLSSTVGPPEDVRGRPRDGAVQLNWSEPVYSIFGPVEEIEIYRSKVEDNLSFYKEVGTEKNGYLDENVTNDETYHYRLRASAKGNFSVLTEFIEVRPDGTSPTIIDFYPTGEKVSVDTVITVRFSDKMDEESVDISIAGISGEVRVEENIYHFEPDENLSYETTYEVSVSGRDIAGNILEGGKNSWSFTTISSVTVRGRIVDEDGEPIEGVLIDPDMGTQNVTDSDGEFEIKLERGTREIYISKTGYVEQKITLEITEEKLASEKTIGEVELEEEKSGVEESKWFVPVVIIAISMFLLGVISGAIFLLGRETEDISSEEDIHEEEYEDVSQEEFDSWWDEEE